MLVTPNIKLSTSLDGVGANNRMNDLESSLTLLMIGEDIFNSHIEFVETQSNVLTSRELEEQRAIELTEAELEREAYEEFMCEEAERLEQLHLELQYMVGA